METIIQAVFANEVDAFVALRALEKLDYDIDVSLGEVYVIGNDGHGNALFKSAEGETVGEGMAGGALLGGLLGLLGGPVGVVLGGTMGLLLGTVGDVARSSYIDDYLDTFAKQLSGRQTMLVAHLWEDSFATVDAALKPFGVPVTRVDVDLEIDIANQNETNEINRQIAQAEAEAAASNATNKAEREAKVAEWKAKLDDARAKAKTKAEEREKNAQTWLDTQHKKFDDWRIDVDIKMQDKKRERLQERINKQEAKLAELHAEAATA